MGGAGDDSVSFTFEVTNTASALATAGSQGSKSNTYFFGSSGGKDTLSFTNTGTFTGKQDLTIAVDQSYGLAATSITFTSATSLISIGSSASIFVIGSTELPTQQVRSLQLGIT